MALSGGDPLRRQLRVTPIASPSAAAFAGLAALAVAMGIGRFAFTPILPLMQADRGLTVAEGGWLASANYLGYLLGALSAVAIRIPTAVTIRGGLVLIGLATLGMGFEHRFSGWVVLRLLAGVASAWVLIAVSAWALAELTPLRRPVLSSTVFAGVGAGIAAAGSLCLLVTYRRATSAQAWIALGVLAFVVTAVTWPVFGRGGQTSSLDTGRSPSNRHRWNSESIRLVLCYGAFGFGYIIPATFLPVMARQAVHDPWIFGWAWPVFGLAAAVSTFSGALSRRIGGNRRLWTISQFIMALGVSLPVFLPSLAGIMLAALFVGGTFMVNTMAGMQEARAAAGADATPLMAAMTAAFALGQITGPILVSSAAGAGAEFSRPLLIACAVLVVSACVLSVRPSGANDGF
jgi:MFS family permease